MFKTLSNCEAVPRGKQSNEQAQIQKQSNIVIGCQEWESKQGSMYNVFHNEKKPDPSQFKAEYGNTSHFSIDPEIQYVNNVQAPTSHFVTEKMIQHRFFQNYDRAQPMDSSKTTSQVQNYFGEDQNTYQTTYNKNHDTKLDKQLPDIRWKGDRVRYDIISNQDLNQNALQKASQFDFFQPNSYQGRTTKNITQFPPQTHQVDIITGRAINY